MSTLTSKIRKVIGKGSSSSGRGMTWMYVDGTGDEDGRAKVSENEQVIQSLIDNFETYELVQKYEGGNESVQFISFIYNSRTGDYIGSCKIDRWNKHAKDGSRFIVVDYISGVSKEEIEKDVKESVGFQSFTRV